MKQAIAIVALAVFAVTGAAALTLATAHKKPKPAPVEEEVAPKADKLPVPRVNVIRVVPITAPPQHVAMAVAAEPEPKGAEEIDTKAPEPTHPTDVCARSGGRRIEINHGRNWKCVYPRRR